MKALMLLCLLALSSLALARGDTPELPGDVARFVTAAQREILIAAPVLRVPEVANALRLALVGRGVKIYAVTGKTSARDAGSYWWSLERAGLQLRTVARVTGFELIVDERVRVTGDLIGRALEPGEANDATLERGSGARRAAERFRRLWATAVPHKGTP
jgi:hypothetical protein